MKEGFDREIDSLLRRTARSFAGARGNGAGMAKPDTHLDADELAAFAEGALPEAARSNAVSHLADCGECRSLAVNLTSAAGVEAKLEKHAVAAAASSPARESKPSRGWLASIFAPRTLRYVAPALVVCLVAVVSFIALRSRSGNGLVSLREPMNDGARPSIATTQNSTQSPTEGEATVDAPVNANTATTTKSDAEVGTLNDKKTAEVPAPELRNKDVAADAPDGSAPRATESESKAAGEGAASQPPSAAKEEDSAAAPPPPPREAAKSAQVAEVPATKSGDNMKGGPPAAPAQNNDELSYRNESQQQKRGLEPQAPDGGARQRSAANNAASGRAIESTPRDDRDARSRRAENAPSARRGRSDQSLDGADSDRANTSGESRSVAGHRFRREGGAWVDFNYKPSMSLTGVRRGTDAYRSLVTNIPEIGRAAEQLGGEVIVVVRGRAYRVQ